MKTSDEIRMFIDREFMYSKKYPHANIGIKYLIKIGYKIEEIHPTYRGNGCPDIITFRNNETLYWEVKLISGAKNIFFTKDQIILMEKDTTILIFRKGQKDIDPIEIIRFRDLLNSEKYSINVYGHKLNRDNIKKRG